MPHIIVKLWPGPSDEQKIHLANEIVRDVVAVLNSSETSISVAIEEISPDDWAEKVYQPDIVGKPDTLYKQPGYKM